MLPVSRLLPLAFGYFRFLIWQRPLWKIRFSRSNKLKLNGKWVNCKLSISGKDNNIVIKNCFLRNVSISIKGNNHNLIIEEDVKFMEGGKIRIEDTCNSVFIGKKSSLINCFLSLADHNTNIKIGENCLFSSDVIIRTSDSHSIIDIENNKRINPGQSVEIGEHVWVCNGVNIMKGVKIGDNSIIGTQSLVTRDIPENSLAVGNPAKVVKSNVNWNVKRLKD